LLAKPLTPAAVKNLKSGKTRRTEKDGGARSLYLVIQPSGHKSWLMRFRRPDGKPGKMVLGPVDLSGREGSGEPAIGAPLTLSAARQLASRVLHEKALGRDPVADHKAAKHRKRTAQETAEAKSFGVLVRRYAEEHGKPHQRRWRYTLKQLGLDYPHDGGDPIETKGGLAQRWADKPVTEIDGHDVYAVLDEAERIGTPGITPRRRKRSQARAIDLHIALSSLFGWLLKFPPPVRVINSNPATGAWRPQKTAARERVLTPDEIKRFWLACGRINGPFGAVCKLLLLTGCRRNEIAKMRHDELVGETLHLPGTRTKNKKPHQIPLPPLALQIIDSLPRIEGCSFVFTTNGRTPISGWTKVKRQLDAEMGNPPPFRIHDLRRTAVTGMAELRIPHDVIELCVNHISGVRAGVAGTYNRAQLLSERQAALVRWSNHIQGLVGGKTAKVVRLRRK
jgi:integrase